MDDSKRSDGRKWVWKKSGEGLSERLVEGTVKFGGGHIMLWGCLGVTNCDTATGHVTGPYVYNSIVSLCSSLV